MLAQPLVRTLDAVPRRFSHRHLTGTLPHLPSALFMSKLAYEPAPLVRQKLGEWRVREAQFVEVKEAPRLLVVYVETARELHAVIAVRGAASSRDLVSEAAFAASSYYMYAGKTKCRKR